MFEIIPNPDRKKPCKTCPFRMIDASMRKGFIETRRDNFFDGKHMPCHQFFQTDQLGPGRGEVFAPVHGDYPSCIGAINYVQGRDVLSELP